MSRGVRLPSVRVGERRLDVGERRLRGKERCGDRHRSGGLYLYTIFARKRFVVDILGLASLYTKIPGGDVRTYPFTFTPPEAI